MLAHMTMHVQIRVHTQIDVNTGAFLVKSKKTLPPVLLRVLVHHIQQWVCHVVRLPSLEEAQHAVSEARGRRGHGATVCAACGKGGEVPTLPTPENVAARKDGPKRLAPLLLWLRKGFQPEGCGCALA